MNAEPGLNDHSQLFPLTLNQNQECVKEDLEIESQGSVFDIEYIVLEALDHFIDV